MAKASVQSVIVTVQEQHIPTIQTVANALRAAGMHVINVLSTAGIITGEVAPAQQQALARIPGVAAVEPDQQMHAL